MLYVFNVLCMTIFVILLSMLFFKEKNKLLLLPISTSVIMITFSFLTIFKSTGTNNYVEFFLIIGGIIIPVSFLFFEFKNNERLKMGFDTNDDLIIDFGEKSNRQVSKRKINSIQEQDSIKDILNNISTDLVMNNLKDELFKAQSYIDKKQYNEAYKIYDKIVYIFSDCSHLLYNHGILAYNIQNYSQAIISFNKSIDLMEIFITKLKNEDDKKKNIKGNNINTQKDTKIREFELIEYQKYKTYYNLANSFFKNLNYKEALKAYEKTIEINPLMVEAYENIGETLMALKNYDEGIIKFTQLTENDPKNYKYNFILGKMFFEKNEDKLAIEQLKNTIEKNNSFIAAFELLGEIYYSNRQYTEAVEIFNKLTKIMPENIKAQYLLANALLNVELYSEAIIRYKKVVDSEHDFYEAHYNVGICYEKLNITEDAIRSFRKVIDLKSDFISAYTKLYEILSKRDRSMEIISICTKGLQKNSNEYVLYFYLGITLNKLGRYQEALDSFRNVFDINPELKGVNLYKGIALNNLGKNQEAITIFKNILQDNPDDTDALYNLAISYSLQKRTDKAINTLKKALIISPELKEEALKNPVFEALKDEGVLVEIA